MIEIVSLLFGLVSGYFPVEVSVAGEVAEVELHLDGRLVGVRDEPPWRFECDFGPGLAPHELVAVARDAEGGEIDRARRWVNVQQQPVAEAALVFSGGTPGRPEAVGLVWESIGQQAPASVEMTLDGEPLAVSDPARVPLPPYDPERTHFLSATVRFRDDTVSRLDAGFGGDRAGDIATGLTAVAVTLEDGARLPKAPELAGWFEKDGEALEVHGVEDGPAEVVVVRDPALQSTLERLVALIEEQPMGRAGKGDAFGRLEEGTSLRVLSPAGAPLAPTEITGEMFARSPPAEAAEEGLLWLSQQVRPRSFPMLFPTAVAIAGMQAHASTRTRAVVLLLGSSPTEIGSYSPEQARDYLRLLRVPLLVWSLDPEPRPEWEGARHVPLALEPGGSHKPFRQAVEDLRRELAAQRVVWLEGSHLPQSIELSPRAAGIRLAGSR